MSIIENCLSIKVVIREGLQPKRPINNARRAAWFLSCARRKAKSPKEVAQAFQRGLDRWKIFEKKTAAYHVEKFFLSQFRDEEKSDQTAMQESIPTRKNSYKKRRMGKSDHKTSEDSGDDNDADSSIQTGGGLGA